MPKEGRARYDNQSRHYIGIFLCNTGLDCSTGPITITGISGVKEQTPLTTSQINHPKQVNNSAVKRVKEHGVLQNSLSERSFITRTGVGRLGPGLEKSYTPLLEKRKFATPSRNACTLVRKLSPEYLKNYKPPSLKGTRNYNPPP